MFQFFGGWTSVDGGLNATSPANGTTGFAGADFLVGTPGFGMAIAANRTSNYEFYQAYYMTDTYRVNPKLSLNAGVRWELPGAQYEGRDRATVLLPNATDPLGSSVGMSLTGQLALVNSSAYPHRTLMDIHYKLFAPRVGFSYDLSHGAVVHGGYGISYLPSDASVNAGPSSSPINSARSMMVTSINGNSTPFNVLNNPFPASPGSTTQSINPALGRLTDLSSLEGQSISSPIPSGGFPYTQQWNFFVEKQVGGSASASLGYIGSKGTALPLNLGQGPSGGFSVDQLQDKYLSQGAALSQQVANPFFGHVQMSALAGPTVSAGQLLLPHPQFTNVANSVPFLGSLSYNALLAKVEKRFNGGGSILVSYVWSKMISDVESSNGFLESGTEGIWQDNTNPRGERSVSDFNVPQRLVASYVLDLPFGKGQRLLGNASGLVNEVVGGWSVNGIVTLQSGFPLSFTANQGETQLPSFNFGTIRPMRTPACSFGVSGSDSHKVLSGAWFNTNCVTQPGAYQLGNESRVDSQISSAGVANWDLATSKKFAITEKINFEFRAEFFNLFNRVQFAAPSTQTDSPTLGTISSQYNQPRLMQFAGRIRF
jgi:hypothetical protein